MCQPLLVLMSGAPGCPIRPENKEINSKNHYNNDATCSNPASIHLILSKYLSESRHFRCSRLCNLSKRQPKQPSVCGRGRSETGTASILVVPLQQLLFLFPLRFLPADRRADQGPEPTAPGPKCNFHDLQKTDTTCHFGLCVG